MTSFGWYDVKQKLKEMSEISKAASVTPRSWGGSKELYYETIWTKWNMVCEDIFKLDNNDPRQKALKEQEHLYHGIMDTLRKDQALCIWAAVNIPILDN